MRYIDENRKYWDSNAQTYIDAHPEFNNENLFPSWGIWYRSESELNLLSHLCQHSKILDIGCGIGNNMIGWANRGMNCYGINLSKSMIDSAVKHINCHYICSPAERMPFCSNSFDAAYCNHGAFDFSLPTPALREINRTLKIGAPLIICTYSELSQLCYSRATGELQTSILYPFKKVRLERSDNSPLVVSLSHSAWIDAFEETGFRVKKLIELTAKNSDHQYYRESPRLEWAAKWPAEDIWKVEKYKDLL